MKRYRIFSMLLACLVLSSLAAAQTSSSTSALPRLVRFSGTASDVKGNPLSGVVGVTFALYPEQTGGAPLWMETQNVQADSNGRYSALLGVTRSEGLPADVFTTEQAHWVGVQVQGQAEQPRVLLLSVPYALKAGDADTIGGLPPSAFVLAAPSASGLPASAIVSNATPDVATDVTTTGGTANFLPLFNGASTVVDSVVYQTAAGKIGINTTTPNAALDVKGSALVAGTLILPESGVATATTGYNSEPLDLTASAFNASAAVAQTFQLKAEPVRNDTTTASGVLSLLFGSGGITPTETGLNIASNGRVTFASGQTFPGLPQLNAANTFTQLLTVTATNNTGLGTITGNNNSPYYGTAAVEGNATFTGTGSTIGVEGYSQATAGWGVYGIGGAAGVYGGSALNGVFGNSTNGNGVYGQTAGGSGSGVYGVNSVSGFGVLGQATGSSGQGVWGESFGTSTSNGAGPDGVHGVSHSNAGAGVAGINTATDAAGVYGSDTSGYGFLTDSHASQARSAGGWVKAMVYINPYSSANAGGIQRCFNSQLPGSQATTVPCGITFTYQSLGHYLIDFGFQVDDRFLQTTESGGFLSGGGSPIEIQTCLDDFCGIGPTQVQMYALTGPGNFYDVPFWLTIL